jgi:Mrp family chromosome partitioning ATPase
LSAPEGAGPGWRTVLVLTLIGAAIGFGWGIADRPVYRATATVVVASDSEGADEARLARFAERGESTAVARRAAAVLGRDVPGADLLADVSVEPAPPGGHLLVTAESEAADVAAAAADGFARALVAVEGDPLALGAAATIPAAPALDRPAGRWAGIGALAGLVVGLLAVAAGRRRRAAAPIPGAADEHAAAAPRWRAGVPGAEGAALGPDPAAALAGDPGGTLAIAAAAAADAGMLADRLGVRSAAGPRSVAVVPIDRAAAAAEVASVLAIAAAGSGRRALVVDADLEHPALADRLGVAAVPGLAEYLAGRAAPQAVLRAVAAEPVGFACVPAGADPAGTGVAGSRFAALTARLQRAYDVVLLVAPPLGSDDAVAVAGLVDGIVVVAGREGDRADIDRAAGRLGELPVNAIVTAS